MRIEYVETETERVILLYDATRSDVETLLGAFAQLGSGDPPDQVVVENLPGVSAVDGCSLALRTGGADLGIEPVPDRHTSFSCTLGATGWWRAHRMLEPFLATEEAGRHQYLLDAGEIEWVISTHETPGW
jgi:hypothetical protein